MRFAYSLVLSLVVGGSLVACAGKAPPGGETDDDATDDPSDDAPLEPDAMEEAPITAHAVSGKVMDYNEASPLADSMVATAGIDPAMMATSIADGVYTFDAVPIGSKVFLDVTHTNYRPTHNVVTAIADVDIADHTVYALSTAFVNSQYTLLGKTPTANTAVVFAELQQSNGTPLVGVPITGITFVAAGGDTLVPGVLGPYVIDGLGQVSTTATVTELHNGSSRIAFLDVPAGTAAIKITYDPGTGTPTTVREDVATTALGATLSLVKGMVASTTPNPTDPKFGTDIYPRLQRASAGGLGCANCHTANGPAALLQYDKPATETLAAILAATGVVNLTTPADSLLLTKPLYEPTGPQNHPNATFLTVDDPDYKLFLLWITNGAKP